MEKCKSSTKEGSQCQNHPMKNSSYCYIHSLLKIEGVPFWKNSWTHLITIITFGLTVLPFMIGPTKKNQETIINNQEEIKSKLSSVKEPRSIQNSKALSYEEKQAYKAIISKIFNDLKPYAKVRIDDSIQGIDSKKNHVIDISIRANIENQQILSIVKTNAGTSPIDVEDISSVYSIVNDIRAAKGIIVSNAGFTQSAKHLAPSYGIDLYSINDAKSRHWNEEVKIPVLYLELNDIELHFGANIYIEEGDTVYPDPNFQFISIDGGKTKITIANKFISLWNNKQIPSSEREGIVHKFNFESDTILYRVGHNKWSEAKNATIYYRFKRDGYLKYFDATDYKAIKNHLTGRITPTQLLVKIGPFDEVHSWIKVHDIDDIMKRTKGYLVKMTQISQKLKGIDYRGDFSLKKSK